MTQQQNQRQSQQQNQHHSQEKNQQTDDAIQQSGQEDGETISAPSSRNPTASSTPAGQTQSQSQSQQQGQSSRENWQQGLCVGILSVDGFEQAELFEPLKALKEHGVKTQIISQKAGSIQGFEHTEKGQSAQAEISFEDALQEDYDALVLPGGVVNADAIRVIEAAQQCVKKANDANKPIAVVCHGAWLLISADLVEGRTLTSWPSLQDDIRNAGGTWVDTQVCVDRNWISSRKPDDLPAFCATLITALQQASSGQNGRSINQTRDELAAEEA